MIQLLPTLAFHGEDATTAQVDGSVPQKWDTPYQDTTQRFAKGSFFVPTNIDSTGTVTFRVAMYAEAAVAAKNVEFRLEHAPLADGEAMDVSSGWTAEDSGDIALDATQGDLTIATWTETVASLGWLTGEWVAFRLSRIDPSTGNLSGDVNLVEYLSIEIPTRPELLNVVAKTSAYTVETTDDVVEVDCTSGNVIITLYTKIDNEGRHVHVRKVDGTANTVTLTIDGSETINGDTTLVMAFQYDAAHLYVGATEWGIL